MNLNNFTIKAQEAVQQAVQLVTKITNRLSNLFTCWKLSLWRVRVLLILSFRKLGVNAQNLNMVLDRQIESYPKVSGGEPYLSSESNAVLQKAIDYSSKWGINMYRWSRSSWRCSRKGAPLHRYWKTPAWQRKSYVKQSRNCVKGIRWQANPPRIRTMP